MVKAAESHKRGVLGKGGKSTVDPWESLKNDNNGAKANAPPPALWKNDPCIS